MHSPPFSPSLLRKEGEFDAFHPLFAMQREGINFIEKLKGLEGYMIDKNGIATMTSGFEKLCK